MKSNYYERAKKFLASIYPYIENYLSDDYGCEKQVNKYNYDKSRKVRFCNGMTRVALVTSDYVVKFDYDAHNVERYGGCELEAKFYQYAKQEGFAYLFAEIMPYEYNGHMFYIMPKIDGIGRKDGYAYSYMNQKDSKWVRHNLHDMHEQNYGWKNHYPVIIDYALNKFMDD